ncbi:hypothetical protein ACH5RR_022640 [Cinchona calisaya]|uniref:Endonuclease/exonuclease/phosphatase domain-containing protein n=1 Tax=Cinchona calisaya TaxID=153742 RepID=A0ABD2Z9E5_9GENT
MKKKASSLVWEVKVRYESDTPVVGIDFNPSVHLTCKGYNAHLSPPAATLKFFWHREQNILGSTKSDDLRKPNNNNWIVVSSSRIYVPSEDDIGRRLLLVLYATDDDGGAMQKCLTKIFFTSPVIQRPRPCPRNMLVFCSVDGLSRNPNARKPFKDGDFKVLSYNILADLYSKRKVHGRRGCPAWALTWEYRRKNLLEEMLSYDADVLCLQEVQSDHFKNFFEPEFERFGYSAIYKKKTNGVYDAKRYIIDGCAIFFKKDRFKMVVKYEVEYDKMALPLIEKIEQPERRNEGIIRLMKDNVAIVVILEGKDQQRICVANTHIHRGASNASYVRLFQVVSLIRGLEKIDASGIPVLVCGDMNSIPGSDPHRFLVNGAVGRYPPNSRNKDPFGMYKHLKLSHSMNLASAYSQLPNAEEVESGTLDYILYSENRMKVEGLLKPLDLDSDCKKRKKKKRLPIPSPLWSSDHVALMANFRISKAFRGLKCLPPPADPWEQQKSRRRQQMQQYSDNMLKIQDSRFLITSAC